MTPTTTSITHALDLADARHWTRQPPRRPAARLRHLLQTQDATTLAIRRFTRPETLTRWAQGHTANISPIQTRLIEREIYRSWQTAIRHKAHQRILEQHGCVTVQIRARFTYTTPHYEHDDPRLHYLTEELPAPHARALFEARHQDTHDDRLRRILADGIAEAYFFRALPPDQQQAAVTISDLHHVRFHY
ncbi:telomere-protecting terminal protein Tpg [Streptomyces virginiae]